MNSLTKSLILLAFTAALPACGGGGGGGGTPAASAFAKIDAQNAAAISGEVVEAALASGELSDLVDTDPLSASGGIGGIGKTGMHALGKLGLGGNGGPAAWFQAAIGPVMLDCDGGGRVTLSGEVTDPNVPTQGDRLRISFDQCQSGDGELVDGDFEIVVDQAAGNFDTGEFELSVTLDVDGLTATDADGTEFVDGRVAVDIDTSQPPISSITVSGDNLTAGEDNVTRTLAEFVTAITTNEGVAPPAYTFTSSGSVLSSEFDGAIDYSTPVTFEGTVGEDPYTGELLIVGADQASIRMIALDNVNVRLLVDEDGDGAIDATIDTTWDAIRD